MAQGYHYHGTTVNASGVPVSNASISVTRAGTTTVVDIFSDVALTAVLANPFTVNADGTYNFWVRGGQSIRIRVSAAGTTTLDVDDLVVPHNLEWEESVVLWDDFIGGNSTLEAVTNSAFFYGGVASRSMQDGEVGIIRLTGDSIAGASVVGNAGRLAITQGGGSPGTLQAWANTARAGVFRTKVAQVGTVYGRRKIGLFDSVPTPTTDPNNGIWVAFDPTAAYVLYVKSGGAHVGASPVATTISAANGTFNELKFVVTSGQVELRIDGTSRATVSGVLPTANLGFAASVGTSTTAGMDIDYWGYVGDRP